MLGIYKERANLRRLSPGIELGRVPLPTLVTAEQCLSQAPTPATNDDPGFFDNEVGTVVDELRVDTEGALKSAFNLFRSIVRGTQTAR